LHTQPALEPNLLWRSSPNGYSHLFGPRRQAQQYRQQARRLSRTARVLREVDNGTRLIETFARSVKINRYTVTPFVGDYCGGYRWEKLEGDLPRLPVCGWRQLRVPGS
jgi:hypothetical protein